MVYTNGTVLPNETQLAALQADNVWVHISDYGPCSKHLSKLEALFTERGIRFSQKGMIPGSLLAICACVRRTNHDLRGNMKGVSKHGATPSSKISCTVVHGRLMALRQASSRSVTM